MTNESRGESGETPDSAVLIDSDHRSKTIAEFDALFGRLRFRCVDVPDKKSKYIREAFIDLDCVGRLKVGEDGNFVLCLNSAASRDGFDWGEHEGKFELDGNWRCVSWSDSAKVVKPKFVKKVFPDRNSYWIIRYIERLFKLTQHSHRNVDFRSLIAKMAEPAAEGSNLPSQREDGASGPPSAPVSSATIAESRKIAVEGLREIYKEAHGEMRARRSTEFEIVRSHLAACGFLTAITNAWVAAAKPQPWALLVVALSLFGGLVILWWSVHKRIAYDNNTYRYYSAVKSGVEEFWLGKTLGEMQPKLDIGPRGDGYRRTQTMMFNITACLLLLNLFFFSVWAYSNSSPSDNHAASGGSVLNFSPSVNFSTALAGALGEPPEAEESAGAGASSVGSQHSQEANVHSAGSKSASDPASLDLTNQPDAAVADPSD